MNSKRPIRTYLNNLFYREYRLLRKTKKYLKPYYTPDAPKAKNERKQIIVMVDGRKSHGGLVDRLRGIITTYFYCLNNDLDFRIHFTSPFRLDQLLIPNQYDWRISEEEISYHPSSSLPVYINTGRSPVGEVAFQQRMVRKYFSKPYRQIHVYTNIYYADEVFGELFSNLFKPVPQLQNWIEEQTRAIGSPYWAVATRFLNLLGDFADGDQAPLSSEEQERLIRKCLDKIKEIRTLHSEGARILVTSDSATFLNAARELDFVYILPGEIGHMDVKELGNLTVHMKTFLDFFMLSGAQGIDLLITGHMYKSGFSKRAAKLRNIPFTEVEF